VNEGGGGVVSPQSGLAAVSNVRKLKTQEDQLREGFLIRFQAMIDIRQISIKCGHCDTYQTLVGFSRREGWHIYTYECENDKCDPAVTRTLLEVPAHLDEFARRDPAWTGHPNEPEAEATEPKTA
jgi:hypothetical protein